MAMGLVFQIYVLGLNPKPYVCIPVDNDMAVSALRMGSSDSADIHLLPQLTLSFCWQSRLMP